MTTSKFSSQRVVFSIAMSAIAFVAIGLVGEHSHLQAQAVGQSTAPQTGTIVIQSNQPIQNQIIQSNQIQGQATTPPMAGSSSRNGGQITQSQPMVGSSSKSVPGPVTTRQAMQSARVVKTEAEWRQLLTPMQFYVTRQKGTERAFSGALWNNKAAGTYKCSCCDQPLFHSSTKFESGTGWPSYNQPVNAQAITNVVDRTGGMVRTETICSRCDAHLGHVFKDGPAPTGLRYCMNSASLKFEKAAPLTQQAYIDPITGQLVQPQPAVQSTTLPATNNSVIPANGGGVPRR